MCVRVMLGTDLPNIFQANKRYMFIEEHSGRVVVFAMNRNEIFRWNTIYFISRVALYERASGLWSSHEGYQCAHAADRRTFPVPRHVWRKYNLNNRAPHTLVYAPI